MRAEDEAGNINEKAVIFTTETSWESLEKNITHYAEFEYISQKRMERFLTRHARRISRAVEFLERHELFFQRRPRIEQRFVRRINRNISLLQRFIRFHEGKSIDAVAADRLTESLEALKM